jgi:D-amino-acid oxidase
VRADAVVVGAGVSGLTSAVCLAEAGLRVRLWAAEPPAATTSAAAGALWGPYLVKPLDRVRRWSAETSRALHRLADVPGTGVRIAQGVEASRELVGPPDWLPRLDGARKCPRAELPAGFVTGWRFAAPLVDMTTYLPYLQNRLATAGTEIETRRITSFAEAVGTASLVINCAGTGARDLVPDPGLTPVRGQLVVVRNPGLSEFFTEDTGASPDLLHIYPHGETAVLGGTAEPGRWCRDPDPAIAEVVVDRCAAVEPRLAGAAVIGHRVGLRPTRDQVRIETEYTAGLRVIHNYGHGGAGLTLSWGCAAEVTALAIAGGGQATDLARRLPAPQDEQLAAVPGRPCSPRSTPESRTPGES